MLKCLRPASLPSVAFATALGLVAACLPVAEVAADSGDVAGGARSGTSAMIDARRHVMQVEVAVRRDILTYDMDLAAVRRDADTARARYHAARMEVIKSLRKDPAYRQIEAEVHRARQALSAAEETFEARFKHANRLLRLRSQLGSLEREAVLTDSASMEARFALQDAYAALKQARDDYEQRVADNSQLRQAREQLLALRRARAGFD
ncbi:MAG: hypothetical protein ACFCVE_09260 [Phycisphaerae bacterium]